MWWFASVSKGRLQSHCLIHAVLERNGALVLANQLSFFPYSFELSLPLISCIDATTRSLKNPPSFTHFLAVRKIYLVHFAVYKYSDYRAVVN